jgi:nucleotide-binding universal stress UspA family protein
MAKKILVPLKRDDRVEEIVPCVEKVAKPGMKVVFLLRYPGEDFGRILDLCARMEGGMTGRSAAARELTNIYSWEGNVQRAQRKVSAAREVLKQKGVEVDVDVYTGSLRKAVRGYTVNGDVDLIVTPAGMGTRIVRFLSGTISLMQAFKRANFSPAVLIHPTTLS